MNPTEMNIGNKKIILASASPRRKELLAGLCVEFEVDTRNNFEETYSDDIPHENIPEILSEGKSYGFHRELASDEILRTSDTLVLCEDHVMGKPADRDEAYRMLRLLSGKPHKVITAITLRDCSRISTLSDTALVHFKELSDEEIYYYIDNFNGSDISASIRSKVHTLLLWDSQYTLYIKNLQNLLLRHET